jgi:hypothetical protein
VASEAAGDADRAEAGGGAAAGAAESGGGHLNLWMDSSGVG